MLRLFVGCAALTLAVTACSAGEKKPAVALKELLQESEDAFEAARTEEAKTRVVKNLAAKLLKFADKNAKDSAALQALVLTVSLPGEAGKDSPRAKALGILKKDYADHEDIGAQLQQLGMLEGDDVFDFLTEVFEKNTNRNTRAEALKAIIGNREQALVEAATPKQAAALRKEIDTYRKHLPEFKDLVKDLFAGATMPQLHSKDLSGKDVKLSDLKGKVVVLDCWATWCGPCRAMIPHSRKLVARLKEKPFVLVGVSFDDDAETVKDFKSANPMPWTHWFNGEKGEIGEKLEVRSFPTVYVLDAKGVIRYRNVRGEALDKAVDNLLKEMEAEKGK